MKVVTHADVTGFWEVAGPVLTADPIRNTLPLSIVSRLRHGLVDGESMLLTVHDGPDAVAAAIATPAAALVLGAVPAVAAVALADHLAAEDVRLPGVTGLAEPVSAFLTAWAERTGVEPARETRERLYALGMLVPPADVPGVAAPATEADVDLLAEWRAAAVEEIFGRPASVPAADQVRGSMAMGNGQLVWRVAGEPVAYAAVGKPRAGISRIGPVFTPPEHRGHGYGSAVSAAAARWALDRGAEHVVLFADLANPVSNAIYQRIGFRPVTDGRTVEFRP